MFIKRSIKFFVIVLVAFAFASVATAYAASNTVPPSSAGQGSGTISGYTVTNVAYTLDSNNPSSITTVEFDLNAGASTVKASLISGGSTVACVHGSGFHWTCTVNTLVSSADNLTVIAASN
ncbi:MAG: hypothetical protein ABSG01_16645 [Anaerolineales bacterium]|jgi:hypothetical protein